MVSVFDLLAALLLLGGVVALAVSTVRARRRFDHGVIDVSDYSLLVRGLPEDATEEEVGTGDVVDNQKQ